MQLRSSKASVLERVERNSIQVVGVMALCLAFLSLGLLLVHILKVGIPNLSFEFLNSFPSRFAERAGVKSALWGTLWVMLFTAFFSIPLGVASAIYLEEFARKNPLTAFIRVNIANLASVPSIVYGLLGLAVFVRWVDLGRSVVSGALTMSLLILPVIILASSEALRSVPFSIREAAYGIGATKRQAVFSHVLPQALSGIITGIILALSRAVGETAPLLAVGALAFAAFTPSGPLDQFTTLSIQIYNWASRPQSEFHEIAATAIIVLLVFSLGLNTIAIFLRLKVTRQKRS